MRKEDLMLGDWVYNKHFNGEIEPIQIHNIYGTEVNCKTARNRFDVDEIVSGTYMSDLKPIPLTPEILGQNGLERICTDYYDLDVYEENDGLWRVVYSNLECSGFDESVLVSSVHELQHFLRHLKIDKEVEI